MSCFICVNLTLQTIYQSLNFRCFSISRQIQHQTVSTQNQSVLCIRIQYQINFDCVVSTNCYGCTVGCCTCVNVNQVSCRDFDLSSFATVTIVQIQFDFLCCRVVFVFSCRIQEYIFTNVNFYCCITCYGDCQYSCRSIPCGFCYNARYCEVSNGTVTFCNSNLSSFCTSSNAFNCRFSTYNAFNCCLNSIIYSFSRCNMHIIAVDIYCCCHRVGQYFPSTTDISFYCVSISQDVDFTSYGSCRFGSCSNHRICKVYGTSIQFTCICTEVQQVRIFCSQCIITSLSTSIQNFCKICSHNVISSFGL